MSDASDYNRKQLATGALTPEHVTELARHWQGSHDLEVDGQAGPRTIGSIDAAIRGRLIPALPGRRCWPLRALVGGRKPVVTSRHRIHNPDRPTHYGADLFYPYEPGIDPPMKVGDGGRTPKYWIPDNTPAIAQAEGRIVRADWSPTGFRVWVEHEFGWLTGAFHLSCLLVTAGQIVTMGQTLGIVGDNPRDVDARHLHSELYKGDLRRYPEGTRDPELWWHGDGVEILPAL